MTPTRTNKKDLSDMTNDLHMARGMVVKFRTGDKTTPKVIEVMLSCYATPTKDKKVEEYERCIRHIRHRFNVITDKYVTKNSDVVLDKKICDVVFTCGNLKKGYNKSVNMTLYVRQRYNLTWAKVKRLLKNGLSDMTKEMVECFKDEDFTCKKNKAVRKINIS